MQLGSEKICLAQINTGEWIFPNQVQANSLLDGCFTLYKSTFNAVTTTFFKILAQRLSIKNVAKEL